MKIQCLALAALLSAAAVADGPILTGEQRATARELMLLARRGGRSYDIVESLTTEIGPRLAGSEAEGRARDWAVALLKSLGFANVRVEPFAVPYWTRGIERAAIVSPFPQPLTVTALGGSSGTGPEGVTGEVAVFDSLAALQAAADGSEAGRIVFVDEPMTRSRDGSGYRAAVAKRRETAYEARRLGAGAALIRSVGTSSHRFAHTGQMRRVIYESSPGAPTAALSGPDADQLRRALDRGEPVRVRVTLTPRSHPPAESGNVIGEIVGGERPREIVLAGAHLDSWDLGTGAVDDGAGVGIVVAAARLLIEHLPRPPKRTIRIVLFGSEEVGLVGAKAYAERYAAELPRHVVAAESDFGAGEIWRFDTRVGEAGLPLAAEIGAVLEPLGIGPGNNRASGGPDLTFLREAGVPVVGLLQDGDDYFDLHHTADDTLDKIVPDKLAQNVAAYAAFLYLAAEADADFR